MTEQETLAADRLIASLLKNAQAIAEQKQAGGRRLEERPVGWNKFEVPAKRADEVQELAVPKMSLLSARSAERPRKQKKPKS